MASSVEAGNPILNGSPNIQEFFFQKECMDTFLNNMFLEEGDEHNKL